MSGMSKSPETPVSEKVEIQQSGPVKDPVLKHEGIPMDMLHHFNVDIESITDVAKKQLSEVYEMLDGNEMELSDFLEKLRSLENRLGQPSHTETRYGKIWHWAKIQNRIKGLQKQQRAMEDRINGW